MKHIHVVAALAALSIAAPAAAQQVTFMTGPQGGSWIPLGGSSRTCGRRPFPASRSSRRPAPASPTCAVSRRARRRSASATRSRPSTAIAGQPAVSEQATQEVCQVANLYPQYFQVVASANAERATRSPI